MRYEKCLRFKLELASFNTKQRNYSENSIYTKWDQIICPIDCTFRCGKVISILLQLLGCQTTHKYILGSYFTPQVNNG